jgi:hypothetical protein
MRKILLAGATLALAVAAGTVAFANMAPPIQLVRFQGCVKPGVEAGCLIVESGGQTWNVTSAKSKIKVGDFISGSGERGGMSTCMQGEALTAILLDEKPPAHAPCVPDQKLKTQ